MGIGPVEYMVVAFPGNQFKGEIAPALQALQDKGLVRILDLAFVMKDPDGNVVAGELEDGGSEIMEAFNFLLESRGGLLNDDDLKDIAADLEPNSSAGILVWEDLWAAELADAFANAGAVMLDIQRVPRDVVQAALDYTASPTA